MASILKPSWNLIYEVVRGGGQLTCSTGDREKMGGREKRREEKRRDKGTAKTEWKEHSGRKCWRDAK